MLSLLLAFAVTGLCLETRLMTPAELRKRVLMTPVSDFAKFPIFVHTPDFVLASSEVGPPFSLRGQDKSGRHWQVILRDAVRGVWQSAARAQRTYYFAGYTGAAGSGPATWILVLSFDERGQPVPFFITTHGSYDDKGIEDVLVLDGSGPELQEQSYWGNIRDDPGYYVTALYQQRGCYWYRSDGRRGTHVFPAFEKWSVMWKDRPAELVDNPHSKWSVRDSTSDPATGIQTKIIGAEDNAIHVSPEVGCEFVSHEVLVEDSAKGRIINLQPTLQELASLAKRHESVVLTGLYRWPSGRGCDASILWVTTGR